jgi:hypothetical protein
VRSASVVDTVYESRQKKALPPTRARIGRRTLSEGLAFTPTPGKAQPDGTIARKVSKHSARRPDLVLEEANALSLDELVDVAATSDRSQALSDAEMGRAACLELLMMDETDVVFTEVRAQSDAS